MKLFPDELTCVYYVPRKPACGNQKAVHPKGMLFDKYHNLLKFFRTNGLRRIIRQSGKGLNDAGSDNGKEDFCFHQFQSMVSIYNRINTILFMP